MWWNATGNAAGLSIVVVDQIVVRGSSYSKLLAAVVVGGGWE